MPCTRRRCSAESRRRSRSARGWCCSARPSPWGRRRRTMARMCEPRLGVSIQGRIRNLGLSTTRGRFFSRSCAVHPMNLSRGASFHAAVLKPSMATGQPLRVVDGVAHLGADQGRVSEIVVAGDELVPELPFPGATHDGVQVERTDLVEGCRGREQRRLGVRSEDDRPGPALASLGRRQGDHAVAVHGQHGDLGHHVLEPTVGLEPADAPAELSRQAARVGCGSAATSARSSTISSAVKPRP